MKKTLTIVTIVALLMLVVVTACACAKLTVTYDLNYEGAPAATKEEQKSGAEVTLIANPIREGYTFGGWFTDKETTTAFQNGKTTKSITLYAKWTEVEPEIEEGYYLGGSFNGYALPGSDSNYKMSLVENSTTLYYITVNLTEALRDPLYDGHWYKVSKGTWNADDLFGADNYFINPAPVKYTTGDNPEAIGLGSIWIDDNGELTVMFDTATNTVYDSSTGDFAWSFGAPTIYGDFNSWNHLDATTKMTKAAEGNTYSVSITLPAYTGTGRGWSLLTCVGGKFYSAWNSFGAGEQYVFDGTVAAMGSASHIKNTVETTFVFTYDPTTHKTSVDKDFSYDLAVPTIYGDFNNWNIEDKATQMKKSADGTTYTLDLTLPAYSGTGRGWSLLTCLSGKYYSEWNIFGANEQYIFDGTAAAMGAVTYIKNTAETKYALTYDTVTHKVSVDKDFSYDLSAPTIYGDFNNWNIYDTATQMTKAGEGDTYSVSITLPAYEGTGRGWSLITCVGGAYYSAWNSFGAGEQYLFNGTTAGMSAVTYIKNTEETTFLFTYDPTTHKTSADEDYVFDLAAPTIYGDFNNWNIYDTATQMTKDGDNYTVEITLDAYEGTGDGWTLITCIGGMYYNAWNSFGAGEQYVFDGTVAAMGSASHIKNTVETTYVFTYNPTTHITTYQVKE